MALDTTEKLADELSNTIDYFRHEFDITYFEVFGVLDAIKMGLFQEACEDTDDES